MKNRSRSHIIISEFKVDIDRDNVMSLLGCRRKDSVYEDILEDFPGIAKEAEAAASPRAILRFGRIGKEETWNLQEGTPVIYVILTAGEGMERLSGRYFTEGSYLSGMLADAMADDLLFRMDGIVNQRIKSECAIRRLGVSERFEAPVDFPMEAQKAILEETGALEMLGITITKGFMFHPVKTMAYILVLTDDETIFNAQHDCGKCEAKDCMMRKENEIQIKAINSAAEDESVVVCEPGQTILDAMKKAGVYLNAPCGGKGTCGKCRIRVLEGKLDATPFDRMKLQGEELEKGIRLACKAYPKSDCTIVFGGEENFEAVSDFVLEESGSRDLKFQKSSNKNCIIGIDIGTTTIAVSAADEDSGKPIHTVSMINRQRAYGADVISRIQASNEGRKEELQDSIRKDLKEGIEKVLGEAGIDRKSVRKAAIGCNTTMAHLLLGYSCEGLGAYPFTPFYTGTVEMPLDELLGARVMDIPAVVLPGISAFVGGDITAGLLACGFADTHEISILIDLGTNGEMAIGNSEKIMVTSTAAGPAFEGGNISCGVGSVDGAICTIAITEGTEEEGGFRASYDTIGRKPPVGICGTGVIEIVSELAKNGIVDETGLMEETYFDEGYRIADTNDGIPIVFTQKDVRELQLAKSAIRAGIETLILKYGVSCDNISTVYLAGGFGFRMNIEKAVNIGLLPEALAGKVKAVGNTSLGGALRYLTEKDAPAKMDAIIRASEEINLSNSKEFHELYMEHMYF